MKIKDVFWLALKDLSEKKVRTALTVVMVVIGVASIVALVSQTAGISASIQGALSSLGPTSILLSTTKSTGFTAADTSLLSTLPNVSTVIPIVEGSATALANGQNTSASIIGVSSQGLQQLVGGVKLYQGTLYNNTLSPSSVVGYDIAFPTDLSGEQNVQVGQPLVVRISGKGGSSVTVPVTGIMEAFGTSIVPIDTSIIMSSQEAEALLHRSSYDLMLVKANNLSSVTPLSDLITDVYGSSVRVITTQQLIATTSSIIGSITVLLGVIAGISLVVAAIGIMNVMLISVYERTHEIGIMKSLGFKARDVMMIFVFQALIIGILGGVVGIGVGAGASYSLSFIISAASSSSSSTNSTTAASSSTSRGGFGGPGGAGGAGGAGGGAVFVGAGTTTRSSSSSGGLSSLSYQPVFSLATIVLAVLVAVIVSIIAGIYPAWRASKMEPIDALRQL